MEVASFLEAFGCWASAQPDIEGVALVGSHARNAANEDIEEYRTLKDDFLNRYSECLKGVAEAQH